MLAVVAAAAAALFSTGAGATAQRTFVASYGNDANPCSRVAPCRTFGSALAKTSDRGEIVVLDSAGYGTVTIAQSVTIAAPAGVYAGISVIPGNNGVTIDGDAIEVVLRGLSINGQGGDIGILVQGNGPALVVERCEVSGMTQYGIRTLLATNYALTIRDTTISKNHGLYTFVAAGAGTVTLSGVRIVRNDSSGMDFSQGVSVFARDILVAENGGEGIIFINPQQATLTIEHSRIVANHLAGIHMEGVATNGAHLVISDTEIARNNLPTSAVTGGLLVDTSAGVGSATLTRTTINGNGGNGLFVNAAGAYAILDHSVVTGNEGNGIGTHPTNGAVIYSRVKNVVHFNAGGDVTGNVLFLLDR